MGNKLTPRWNPRCDKVIYQCEYFTLVDTKFKKTLGYYNPRDGIRITQNSIYKLSTYAHEYVHMVEKHKGVNNPYNEYLANRVSALLAKYYGWSGLITSHHSMMIWSEKLTNDEISQLKVKAKKLAQSLLKDTYFQEGIKLLESM